MNELGHEFELVRDEKRGRGWYLAWRCMRDCDSRGNMTVPSREKALELFSLMADAHRQITAADPEAERGAVSEWALWAARIARGVAADGAEQMTVERAEARDEQEDQ